MNSARLIELYLLLRKLLALLTSPKNDSLSACDISEEVSFSDALSSLREYCTEQEQLTIDMILFLTAPPKPVSPTQQEEEYGCEQVSISGTDDRRHEESE